MDTGSLYDPAPPTRSRRRAGSFSASSANTPADAASSSRARRRSVSSLPTYDAATSRLRTANISDEEDVPPLINLGKGSTKLSGPSQQDPVDSDADQKLWRDGRQSKQEMEAEYGAQHNTADFESFLAQLYDLTHAIDALENDIDQIVALRNMVVRLDPKVDVGQVSLRADLDTLAALTTKTGRGVVALETWLKQLQNWGKQVRDLVKAGQVGESMEEVGEIKYHLASARLDFEDALERIREGAFKERERRQRTRIWMARHIRAREPGIEDIDVKGLLKAAELGSADGVAQVHVTSYAGLFALQNPFTELAELTGAKHTLPDALDGEIVDELTGNNARKSRKANDLRTPSSRKSSKSKTGDRSSSGLTVPSVVTASPAGVWGSRSGFLAGTRTRGDTDDLFERKFRYIQQEQFATEKDLEYGFARQQQQVRVNRRKKLVIALLLVIIVALILVVVLATMRIPDAVLSFDVTPTSSVASLPFTSATSPTSSAVAQSAAATVQSLGSLASSLSSSASLSVASFSSAASSVSLSGTSDLSGAASTSIASTTQMSVQTQTTLWWTPASA